MPTVPAARLCRAITGRASPPVGRAVRRENPGVTLEGHVYRESTEVPLILGLPEFPDPEAVLTLPREAHSRSVGAWVADLVSDQTRAHRGVEGECLVDLIGQIAHPGCDLDGAVRRAIDES